MLTGVETAGLVLAAFPLVVDGLSHYVNGLQTIRSWRRFRLELENYARLLKNQKTWYLDTLEQLFDGIVQSDEELAQLIMDPEGNLWRKPEYEKRLRLRLDHSFDHYMLTLRHMKKMLGELANQIGVHTSGRVLWNEQSFIDREMSKLKVVLSKGVYKDLLDNIDKANKDLREFTRQNIYLEPVRRKRRSKSLQADFKLIRKQATSLYNVVVMGRSWKCEGECSHMASLRLEPRTDWRNTNMISKLNFRILLSRDRLDSETRCFSEWRELVAEPMEIILSKAKFVAAKAESRDVISSKTDGSNHQNLTLGPPPKRIRFASPPHRLRPSVQCTSAGRAAESKSGLITDLCATLYGSQILQKDLGFLVDDGPFQHRHNLYLVDVAKTSSKIHTESLASLLQDSRIGSHKFNLKRGDRLYIAVTLASSVLQLDRTPWLKRQWRSSDVCFHYEEEPETTGLKPRFTNPYLSWKPSPSGQESDHSSKDATIKGQVTRCEALFTLGLTLVELCFGRTLLEMQRAEDKDSNDAIVRLNTARRLLNDVYDESGGSYGDVVRRCLDCPFDFRDVSLDNDEFSETVFERIVTPLIEDLHAFKGTVASK